jgi:hypothetical protein
MVCSDTIGKELVMNRRPKLVPLAVVLAAVLLVGPTAFAQIAWTVQDLAVEPGPPGTWDSARHIVGDVVFDGETYHMYLLGGQTSAPWGSPWKVGHWTALSPAGPWYQDPDNPVLEPGPPTAWDGFTIYSIAVHFDGSGFHLWYGAAASHPGPSYVGYATNPDGRGDWTKHDGNPLEGLEPGDFGAWDAGGILPSSVLLAGAEYRMWYFAVAYEGLYETWRIGHAVSSDGLEWKKHPDPVIVGTRPWEGERVYHPEVIPWGPGYALWYSGYSGTAVAIGHTVSSNGLDWCRWCSNPVLTPVSPCNVLDSIAVLSEGDTLHGWISHCNGIFHLTAQREVVFFDDLETGDTGVWGEVVRD